jgi:hypothetical protein
LQLQISSDYFPEIVDPVWLGLVGHGKWDVQGREMAMSKHKSMISRVAVCVNSHNLPLIVDSGWERRVRRWEVNGYKGSPIQQESPLAAVARAFCIEPNDLATVVDGFGIGNDALETW